MRTVLRSFVALGIVLATSLLASADDVPRALPSWNDGQARQAIVSFVTNVTKPDSRDFVPEPERIAVFDNDGTLWPEQPVYVQIVFEMDRVKALAPKHPEWKTKEPFASLLKGDVKTALAGGEKALVELVQATHAGLTTDEFERLVKDWLATARHPVTRRPYTQMAYQPMLEVLAYLRANGFKTYLVSGGGVEFLRPWAESVYGIPPEQVIGSSMKTKLDVQGGKPVIVQLPEIDFINDGPGKPVGIQARIGRRPIAAFGNSDGDLPMLQWTKAGSGRRFAMLVHHTDAEREWAYDRESDIGHLEKALDEATAKRWPVIDMKKDWKVIYATDLPTGLGTAPAATPPVAVPAAPPAPVAPPAPTVAPAPPKKPATAPPVLH